jgi:hypothetical protein
VRERINTFRNYFRENIDQYHDWKEFVMGNQWEDEQSALFQRYNKRPLVFNKLAVLMNHLLGQQMQNTPNMQVFPMSKVDAETADIRQAIVKNISLDSNAKQVYQSAFKQAIIGGYGAFRIGTEYETNKSFEQKITISSIKDPTQCYWDLTAKNPCKTDGMYAGFVERMSRRRFKSLYGKSLEKKIGATSLDENFEQAFSFADDDSILVIYDYERIYNKKTIYQLSDDAGSTISREEFNKLEDVEIEGEILKIYNGDEPVSIVNKRQVPNYTVKFRKIAGDYILEDEEFVSEQLPIVFVDQNSYYAKDGAQVCRPFFYNVKDAQMYLNYLATQSAYLIKTMRYDQFMGPKSAVRSPDTEQNWRNPALIQGMLTYDESPNGDKPQQIMPGQISPALMQQYQQTVNDIQTGTGMYAAQMGDRGNEISGAAIDSRIERGSYNTFVPFNSLNNAILCAGEIINEMIPKIYDTERNLMLSMPEAENKSVAINSPLDEYGTQIKNNMTEGDYKIRILPGPSYEGQKQEALESLQEILKASPETFNLIADLYAENLPIPNSIELKNRLRTLVPPEIIQAGKTGEPLPPKPPAPDPQQQMVQLQQQQLQFEMQKAQQQAQIKAQEIDLKKQELQRKAIETQQDVSIAWAKLEDEKEKNAARLQEEILRYQAEMQRTQADTEVAHGDNLVKIITNEIKHNQQKDANNGQNE